MLKKGFSDWFKENTPKEGLSENTTFTRQFLIDAWNNGYINGYNKAKIEVEESYKESLCNSELNLASVTEQLEELKKANEWHDLEENPNVLPTENMKPSLVKDVFGNLIVAYYSLELKSWWGTPEPDFGIEYEIPVVKWKEIVDD